MQWVFFLLCVAFKHFVVTISGEESVRIRKEHSELARTCVVIVSHEHFLI